MKSALVWAVAGLLMTTLPVSASTEETESLDSARSTLAKWVEIQQIIATERKDWQVGKELLEPRIALLEDEVGSLEEKIAEVDKAIAEVKGKKGELVRDSDAMKRASSMLADSIASLEKRTKELVKSLPDPIAERVAPLSHRIPDNPEKTEQTLGTRFQNVIGILDQVNKFNQNITVTSEIRELPDGSSAEVQAVYLGLGQSYYVTPDGLTAGVGRPTGEGWQWTEASEFASRIAQAIAILKNEEVPAFVSLPVVIK